MIRVARRLTNQRSWGCEVEAERVLCAGGASDVVSEERRQSLVMWSAPEGANRPGRAIGRTR